ncbi:MAG TPA: flagellar hook-length control protein FliK, partial [Cellvibrionaceae bacterium]|nr:flagellar hook-length control protein FliK [Cellvibrionaceae bacterium]
WLHYAQDASVVEKPLEVSTLQQPNVPVGLAKNEPQTLALAPLASMPFEASVADAEQPMGTIAAELAPIAANTKELNAPISALNKTNENKALNDVVNGFTSPVDSTEDVGFTSLLAERVPNVLVKPQADVAVQSRELPLLGEASVDSARIPAHQTVVQENQWLGQAQQPGHAVASTALDNKSFLQLRFNQQTLATDLVEKTGWLIEHKVDTAQIQLDPPELGPIAVKIHTHQEQVSVSFVVANPQVRDAMDQTLQRLKDLLQEQGINLSHADVNDQRQQRDNSGEDAPSQSSHGESTDEEIIGIHLPQDELGVDLFV